MKSLGYFKSVMIVLFIPFSFVLQAQNAFTVSTFHNLSIYWSPATGNVDHAVGVQFKEQGSVQWLEGLDMRYNPIPQAGNNPITGLRYDKADYRGSIVNLQPNTTYDIQLTVEGTGETTVIQGTTWTENFPIGEVLTPGSMTTRLSYGNLNGTPDAYILIDGTNESIEIQDGSVQNIRLIDCSYVIIRGYTLTNAATSAIRMFDCHHIVIEDCDISNWGEEDVPGTGFGVGYQSGVYAGSDDAYSCVIQRNKIHHPRWDTNSWAELHDPNSDPAISNNYHPSGPQGISLGQCNIGNNVIRYNEIWSDADHYFNDIVGMWSNASYDGFPGPDSDIYNNYFANCFDDGIESEGCNTNVRIWNNYIDEVFLGIGNAATSIGPLYVWRNVSGRADSPAESVHGDYGGFLKMGYAGNASWMTGQMYIFNNTILQPNDHGCGGLGTHHQGNREIRHCISLNNIYHVRSNTDYAISIDNANTDNHYDYDLTNRPYPAEEEIHGIMGSPTYAVGAPNFNSVTLSGNFQLSSASLGFDDGVVIPNFCDAYSGTAPDMGAHEAGWDNFEYGVLSTFNPPIANAASLNLACKVLLQGPYDIATGLMRDDVRQLGAVPTSEPFTTLGFNNVDVVGISTQPSVLQVEGNNAIVDWIFVEIRDHVLPATILATKSALVQRDGDIVDLDGVSTLSISLNMQVDAVDVILRHRNHLGVKALNFPTNTNPVIVDFTDVNTSLFGDNPMVVVDGKRMLVAGDANNNGQVNANDKNDYWRTQNSEPYDYLGSKADFNMDGTVNGVDLNGYWRINNTRVEELD